MLKHKAVNMVIEKLERSSFVSRHKSNDKDFTRTAKLTFYNLVTLILRKSTKSIQLSLNEFVMQTGENITVTSGAFTKARKKLKHSAFIELNDDIVNLFYSENTPHIKTFKGFRLLGFDGSKINVPNNKETENYFGSRSTGSKTEKGSGTLVQATYEACYDVLNKISLGNILGRGKIYEPVLAEKLFDVMSEKDIGIFDRAYLSYDFMAKMITKGKNFVMRCQRKSFLEIQEMFELEEKTASKTIDLMPSYKNLNKARKSGLPDKIKIRLIKITLPNGEVEVLATSILDEAFTIDDFSEIYRLRWGVETFFSEVKSRLSLENFTGKSVEAVHQDFWATIFISNLETIMTEDIDRDLNKQTNTKKKTKINKAVSFNAIKNKVFELFSANLDTGDIVDGLTNLFLMNRITIREGRKSVRRNISDSASLRFQKCTRKQVF